MTGAIWSNTLLYNGSILLILMFLALCLQLFWLLWNLEYRRHALWLLSVLWWVSLFWLFLTLIGREKPPESPLRLLPTVLMFSFAYTAALTIYAVK